MASIIMSQRNPMEDMSFFGMKNLLFGILVKVMNPAIMLPLHKILAVH